MTIEIFGACFAIGATMMSALNVYLLLAIKLQVVELELKMTEAFNRQQSETLAQVAKTFASAEFVRARFEDLEHRIDSLTSGHNG